jgi:hypothetical protein
MQELARHLGGKHGAPKDLCQGFGRFIPDT